MDYSFVNNRLAVGGSIENRADVDTLAKQGITHIINCRRHDDSPLLQGEFNYLHNATSDDGRPKSVPWFQKSIEFALAGLSCPGTKLYVHCAAGVSRGPSTCYAILRALGMDSDSAEAAIRKVRPQIRLSYKEYADAAITQLGYK